MSIRARTLVLAASLAAAAPPVRAADPAPRPAPIALAAPADLAAAVAAVEKAAGAKAEPLPFGDPAAKDGRSFAVEPAVAERLLEGSHVTFRKAGFYLFRHERSYGMPGEKDRVVVLATGDARAVLRRVGTAQPHHALTTDQIIAWLDALAKDEPFDLLEIGSDYVAGKFHRTPKDPAGIARRCAEFAPDLVAGRASTLDLLAREIGANRTLYLIW